MLLIWSGRRLISLFQSLIHIQSRILKLCWLCTFRRALEWRLLRCWGRIWPLRPLQYLLLSHLMLTWSRFINVLKHDDPLPAPEAQLHTPHLDFQLRVIVALSHPDPFVEPYVEPIQLLCRVLASFHELVKLLCSVQLICLLNLEWWRQLVELAIWFPLTLGLVGDNLAEGCRFILLRHSYG